MGAESKFTPREFCAGCDRLQGPHTNNACLVPGSTGGILDYEGQYQRVRRGSCDIAQVEGVAGVQRVSLSGTIEFVPRHQKLAVAEGVSTQE